MKRLYRYLIPFLLIECFSCTSLSKSQLKSIESYAGLLKENSEFPSVAISECINLKFDIELLNSGTFADTLANEKLWKSFLGREEALKKAHKADLTLKIIKQYAVSLYNISSPKSVEALSEASEQLGKNMEKLIEQYNSLSAENKIPEDIGTLVSNAISLAGKQIIRAKQAREIKKLITAGDTLVGILTDNLAVELEKLLIKDWIPALKADLATRQENLLANINQKGDYKAYYATQYNKEIGAIIERIHNLEQLSREVIKSTRKIKNAHAQIVENIKQKKKISEILSETYELYLSVKELTDLYKKISNN
jgi:hypothetical protein